MVRILQPRDFSQSVRVSLHLEKQLSQRCISLRVGRQLQVLHKRLHRRLEIRYHGLVHIEGDKCICGGAVDPGFARRSSLEHLRRARRVRRGPRRRSPASRSGRALPAWLAHPRHGAILRTGAPSGSGAETSAAGAVGRFRASTRRGTDSRTELGGIFIFIAFIQCPVRHTHHIIVLFRIQGHPGSL